MFDSSEPIDADIVEPGEPIDADVLGPYERRKPNRNFTKYLLGLFITLLVGLGIYFLGIKPALKYEALQIQYRFENHPIVSEQIGEITEIEQVFLPLDKGDFDKVFSVKGTKGEGQIMVMEFVIAMLEAELITENGKWTLYDVGADEETVDPATLIYELEIEVWREFRTDDVLEDELGSLDRVRYDEAATLQDDENAGDEPKIIHFKVAGPRGIGSLKLIRNDPLVEGDNEYAVFSTENGEWELEVD